ncbi:hypothetical protein LINPERHAP1_LOCUS36804 [Linum perenne]
MGSFPPLPYPILPHSKPGVHGEPHWQDYHDRLHYPKSR